MKPAGDILVDSGMSRRSAFYAGRGEMTCDLDRNMLEKIYGDVEKYNGPQAAAGFVNTVADLYFVQQDLSASMFINAVYNLESSDWTYRALEQPASEGASFAQTAADEIRQSGQATGSLLGMMLAMGGGNRKSDGVRRMIGQQFLVNHNDALEQPHAQRLQRDPGTTWGFR